MTTGPVERATVRADPERRLTLGEAAELLGLPDMAIGREVRAGRLATFAGWRMGRLTRVVRAGDLVALDPGVGDRLLPPAVSTELVAAPVLTPEELSAEPGSASPEVEAASGPERGAELEALRGEVEDTRADNQRLLDQLTVSGHEVDDLLQRIERDRIEHEAQLAEHRVAGARSARSLAVLQRTQWALLAGLLLVLALAIPSGVEGGVVHGADLEGAPAAQVHSSAVAGDEPEPRPTRLPQETLPQEMLPQEMLPQETLPQETLPQEMLPQEMLAEDEPEAEPAVQTSAPTEAALAYETIGPTLAAPGDPPCAFFERTRPGAELRALLGPCAGPWSDEGQAVVGVVRRGGEAYCRHHHFFVEQLGGSIARAQEVAALSEREGLVPPLLDLRVDRAGAAFLRRRVGEWIESGFESSLVGGGGHVLVQAGEDRWHLRSWVRYLDIGGVEHRGEFEMDLELDDGPDGDRLLSFEWR